MPFPPRQSAALWRPGSKDRLRLLNDLVLSGSVRYSPAYPLLATGESAAGIGLPAGANMMLNDDGKVIDHFSLPDYDGRLKRMTGNYTAALGHRGTPSTGTVQRLHRQTRLPYRSTIFHAGQVFHGEAAITGTASAVAQLMHQLRSVLGEPLYVGGNARSGFGGELRAFEIEDRPESLLAPSLPEPLAGDISDVVLTTPALVREHGTGQFAPSALASAVNDLFARELGTGAVSVLEWQARPVAVGGFNARFSGLRPDHAAAAAGSVVRIRWNSEPKDEQLKRLAKTPLGARGTDGFGQWRFAPELPRTPLLPRDTMVRTGPGTSIEADPGAHVLTVEKFQARLNTQVIIRQGVLILQELTGQLRGVRLDRGALGELRSLLERQSPDARFLKSRFSADAAALGTRITIPDSGASIPLALFLITPEAFTLPVLTRYLRSWQLDPGAAGTPSPDQVAEAARQLRLSCVEFLREQARAPLNSGKGAMTP